MIARKSQLYGIAFLSHGADPHARAMLVAAMNHETEQGRPMKFEDWLTNLGLKVENLTDQQKAELEKAFQMSQTPEAAEAEAFNLENDQGSSCDASQCD